MLEAYKRNFHVNNLTITGSAINILLLKGEWLWWPDAVKIDINEEVDHLIYHDCN